MSEPRSSSPSPRSASHAATQSGDAAAIQLANQAWEAILSTDGQAGNRSDQAQRAALLAAKSLRRGNARSNQGWDRMEAREYQALRERQILQKAASDWRPDPAKLSGHRGEHSLYRDEANERVIKITHSGRYGHTVDQGNDEDRRRLTLRGALPSEYLHRQGLMCIVFGDDVHLRAVVYDRHYPNSPAQVIEQRYVKGAHDASEDDIRDFMEAAGFRALDARLFDQDALPDGLWYRDADHVLVGDANPSNFVRLGGSRQIVSIDLLMTQYPPELIAEIEARQAEGA